MVTVITSPHETSPNVVTSQKQKRGTLPSDGNRSSVMTTWSKSEASKENLFT